MKKLIVPCFVLRGLPVLILSLCSFSTLFAQPSAEANGDWDVSLGGGVIVKPKYQGSEHVDVWPVPYFDIRYREHVFFNPWKGLGWESRSSSGFNYGASLGFGYSRDEDDGSLLEGLSEIDFGINGRLFGEYQFGKYGFGLGFKHDLSDVYGGYEIDLSVRRTFMFQSIRSILTISIGATYASEDCMQTFFGVSSDDAIRTRHGPYYLDAGMKDVGVSTMFVRRFGRDWSLVGMFNYGKYSSDIKHSPVVETDQSMFGGIFVARSL